MKRYLLFIEAEIIYHFYQFFSQISHRLAAKHTEIYNKIMGRVEVEDGNVD
jgi:hypothetical protein